MTPTASTYHREAAAYLDYATTLDAHGNHVKAAEWREKGEWYEARAGQIERGEEFDKTKLPPWPGEEAGTVVVA